MAEIKAEIAQTEERKEQVAETPSAAQPGPTAPPTSSSVPGSEVPIKIGTWKLEEHTKLIEGML